MWFFNTGADAQPVNFAGRIGAFLAELSYQLLGYAAYLIPIVLVVMGWHYFWCKSMDARYTKLIGAGAALFLHLVVPRPDVQVAPTPGSKEFRAGGYLGELLGGWLSEYLNTTGSVILILTLLFLAIILSTQFSFGRLFGVIGELLKDRWAVALGALNAWREERRRDKQRQEVLKKHLDKAPTEAKEKIAAAAKIRKEPAPKAAPDGRARKR